ncbi:MAG TPA: histidine kinase dimerization/phospho-acceptor domain-containing protein [Candidatus Udaeobacter sp.]|nr:histidine kinase dimerization/phospho-acceptor domain-containing protein [Candidatus Udaeobacter sp.]
MTTSTAPGPTGPREPSEALLATQLRTLFHLHRAWAHDLRAPLNNLTLVTELLRAEIESEVDPTQLQARVTTIREATARMTRLIESFCSLTVPYRDPLAPCDLRALLRELESLLAPEARRRRIPITLELPAEEISLAAARDRLRQACLTVATQVLESIPTGGGELALTLALGPAEVRLGMHARRSENSSAAASSASEPAERPSGITLAMSRALVTELGGELIEDAAAGTSAPGLTIHLPRQ